MCVIETKRESLDGWRDFVEDDVTKYTIWQMLLCHPKRWSMEVNSWSLNTQGNSVCLLICAWISVIWPKIDFDVFWIWSDVKAGLLTFSFQQRRLCVCVYLNVWVCVCVCMGYSIIYHSIYHSVSGERIQAQITFSWSLIGTWLIEQLQGSKANTKLLGVDRLKSARDEHKKLTNNVAYKPTIHTHF